MGAYENQNVVGVDDVVVPSFTQLYQNYPNPFNPSTTISFTLNSENTEDTELVIYNLKGQKIKTLTVALSGDEGSAIWHGTNQNNKLVSSGIYFYKLKTDNYEETKKMILLK